jgi:hypothetical protein
MLLSSWNIVTDNQNAELERFFDNVERWSMTTVDRFHRVVVDVAKPLVSLVDKQAYRLELVRGHVERPNDCIYLARGIVCKVQDKVAVVSLGGLLMAIESTIVESLDVEDSMTMLLYDV